jgi:hypothetical protein
MVAGAAVCALLAVFVVLAASSNSRQSINLSEETQKRYIALADWLP